MLILIAALGAALVAPGFVRLQALDRTAAGALFGVSDSALYRTDDAGLSWKRLGQGTSLRAVFAAADGQHALIAGDSELLAWRAQDGRLVSLRLADAPLFEFQVQARKESLWIATAFEAAPCEETQRLMNTTHTILVGPQFTALAFASPDAGRTWVRIEEYVGAIVHAAWLGNDDVLRLCLSDGKIRGGAIDPLTGAALGGTLETLASVQGIGGHWGSWLAFPDGQTGWAGGQHHDEGASLLRSLDGGRTWSSVAPGPEERIEVFRLGGGACVRVADLGDSGSRVDIWLEGEFREVRRFESAIHDARADVGGCLLVRLVSSEVWSLAADGGEWTRLATIQIPRY